MIAIVWLLFGHFIGDFLLQTNHMALNKAHSMSWLSIHVITYTAVLASFSFSLLDINSWYLFFLINGGLHWVVDFITSKVIYRLNKLPNKKWYYTGIGFDQFLHAACLIMTYDLIT
jgi:hypothetical protein